MKPMSDREMDMRRGEPESDAFFPEEPHMRVLPKNSDIRDMKYPDTDEEIHMDQQEAVRDADRARMKEGFRY